MVTTDPAPDLRRLVEQINAASLALRRSKESVPDEVVAVIDSLDNLLTPSALVTSSSLRADPYQTARLYEAAYRAEKALHQPQPADQRRQLRIPLEVLRSALIDIIEDRPVAADLSASEVLVNLVRMANVPQADLAPLLGVSTRQLQRWLAEGGKGPAGDDEARVRIVAQIVNQLRHSFTAPGAIKWFGRPSPLLGEIPIELLKDPLRYPEILSAARRTRFAP